MIAISYRSRNVPQALMDLILNNGIAGHKHVERDYDLYPRPEPRRGRHQKSCNRCCVSTTKVVCSSRASCFMSTLRSAKESANGVFLRAVFALEALDFLAEFSRQMGGVPEGESIRIRVVP